MLIDRSQCAPARCLSNPQRKPSYHTPRHQYAIVDTDIDIDTDINNCIIRSLYRRSLKLALDWAVHRHIWRGQAVYIRSLFDANKDVRDPRQQKVLPAPRDDYTGKAMAKTQTVTAPRDRETPRDMEAS